jgi:uncharacterized protein (TIGR02217 family)
MADFLEERINGVLNYGSSYQDDYVVNVVKTAGGQEYRTLVHPFPLRKFDVSYLLDNAATYLELLGLYHRAHGKYAGFRVKCLDEFTSNGAISTPTSTDQPMGLISAGVYQLRKYYGRDKTAGSTGYPYRTIKKPVSGTVIVAIGITQIRAADLSINTATGVVTFTANKTATITGITNALNAVITVPSHTVVAGQSILITGVGGMSGINNVRALVSSVTGTTITIAYNTSGFGGYSSGGVLNTNPQVGEAVTAGFEFDFPVRFNTSMPIGQDFPGHRAVDSVELIEIMNP